MIAAWDNKIEFVRELCADKRISLNQQDANGFTALIKACYWGWLECRDIIKAAGADEKIVDRDIQTFAPKREKFIRPATKNVILVDSVINTGKTIKKIIEPDMFVACCVINEQAVALFDSLLYTIRVSKNSFVGTNIMQQNGNVGPDTTMRLFNLL